MSWITLEQGKTRLGIDCTDPGRNAEVQAAINYATAIVQRYCLREFAEASYSQQFFPPSLVVYLKNWPVSSVDAVFKDGVEDAGAVYVLDPIRGVVHFDSSQTDFSNTDLLQINYTGGFSTVPADLTNAVLDVMAARYRTIDADPSKGHIKFERIDGFVSTSYADPVIAGHDGILTPYLTVLDTYRSERTEGAWAV